MEPGWGYGPERYVEAHVWSDRGIIKDGKETMNIETKRTIIRPIRRGDEKAYAEMAKDGSLAEIGFDENFSDWAEDWINEAVALTEKDDPRADYIPCTIVLKTTGEVLIYIMNNMHSNFMFINLIIVFSFNFPNYKKLMSIIYYH